MSTNLSVRGERGLVIVAQGIASEKFVLDRPEIVTPFLGGIKGGKYTLGLGYQTLRKTCFPNRSMLFTSESRLVQYWRGLKILDKLPAIEPDLMAYYEAADPDIKSINVKTRVMSLAQRSGIAHFVDARRRVLNTAPSSETLEQMINLLKDNGIFFNPMHLSDEIKRASITPSERLQDMIDNSVTEERDARAKLDRIFKEIENTPPNQSLGEFLKGLRIQPLLDEGGVPHDFFDRWTKKNSILFGEEIPLFTGSDSSWCVNGYTIANGLVWHPVVSSADGKKHKLIQAGYNQGTFVLTVETIIDQTGQAITHKLTLDELKQMLGHPLALPN